MVPLVLPEKEVQDIDTMEDWELAEQKYIRMNAQTHADPLREKKVENA